MGLYSIYQHSVLFTSLILLIALWDIAWRGMALWRSARRKQLVWFIVLLVLNTAGILPIIYLLISGAFAKKKMVKEVSTEQTAETKKPALKKKAIKSSASKKPAVKKSLLKKPALKKKAVTDKKSNK